MISRIALLLCVVLSVTCVTSQNATPLQPQLSTNQTLALYWTCNMPYATATDDQGIVYSSCAQNNGSQGILWTYRDNNGQMQTGWVTSAGNGSCLQSWSISVSRDGTYLFATCYGNPQQQQVMFYEKMMNGSQIFWNPTPLTSSFACGRDIVFDESTEDVYALCGTSLNTQTRIIRFPHNSTSDSYNTMPAQDLGINANYIKMNPMNGNLYYATTNDFGYLVIHNSDGTAVSMFNNFTTVRISGVVTYYCEITSFTFLHNNSNTLFVGCTGIHDLQTAYTSYSILRVDMIPIWQTVNSTTNMSNSTTTNSNSTANSNSTGNSNSTTTTNTTTTTTTTTTTSQQVLTWQYSAYNITSTDSKAQGADGIQDLSYPADGSCKGPSDMEMDSMNQLYVSCMQNADRRSVIRYTMMNATSYLPAYVTTPAECSHPLTNSLTLTMHDDVIVACSNNNIGLEFTTLVTNITTSPTPSTSSSGNNGNNGNGTNTMTGSSSSGTGTGTNVIINPGSSTTGTSTGSSSGSGFVLPNITVSSSGSSVSVCINGKCTTTSSSTGSLGNNPAATVHAGVGVFLVSILAVFFSV